MYIIIFLQNGDGDSHFICQGSPKIQFKMWIFPTQNLRVPLKSHQAGNAFLRHNQKEIHSTYKENHG